MFRGAVAKIFRRGRRTKMFVKAQDKWGGSYYVLNKWPYRPKRPAEDEYFQVNDLLLDLDDMFSNQVRPVTEEDDEQALKLWSRDRKKKSIRKNLYQLEQRLDESRLRAFQVRSKPLNSWRLGSYDVFSAALRAPSRAPLIDLSEGRQGSVSTSTAETQPNMLHLLCSNNGIENQALEDDSLLLKRFQSRISSSEYDDSPKVSASQLSQALESQDSLTSLRRLVSQYLSCNPSGIAFHSTYNDPQESQPNLSLNVRDMCESFWQQNVQQSTRDLLTFIGNLGQRLSAREEHIGGPLCGFGLRLSAEICVPTISSQYLNMGSEVNHWSSSDQGLKDIHQVLEAYLRHLITDSEPSKLDVKGRRELLKMLAGSVDQEDSPTVRSLILDSLQIKSRGDMARIASDAYRAYIMLLGHLGAAALLQHEMQLFAAGEIERLRGREGPENTGHQPDTTIAQAFQAAIDSIVVPLDKAALPRNLDFANCVVLDLQAIGNRAPRTK
ncbi:hypothetical protein FLONG3_7725 [Fusarium longipes]|uniref:Uncharacterized protein n=1 Tax=Fusarium longipes TaxID=694270 RepID=A0A395SBW4_9HYPO|nr:hypothetical protein FLONG3_7725 [Fusarium longipes]